MEALRIIADSQPIAVMWWGLMLAIVALTIIHRVARERREQREDTRADRATSIIEGQATRFRELEDRIVKRVQQPPIRSGD